MRKALITGASSGLGRELARVLSGRGYDLILVARRRDRLEALARTLPTKAHIICADLSDAGRCKALYDETRGERIDLLINNAGISHIGLLSDMSTAQWRQVMQTNLDAVFFTCRAAIPHMVRRQKGRILNISSVWGEVGASCEAAYSASKGAVNSLTRALAKELGPSHISVNAISLGVIDTAMNQCFNEEERQALAEEIPFGRFASPGEAAAFCCQIAESPEYLTGQILRFDGGWI